MVNKADPHFHSTHSVIYVSYLDPVDGSLRLRAYMVKQGGELEEIDYTRLWRARTDDARPA